MLSPMKSGAYPARMMKPKYQQTKKMVAGITKERLLRSSSWNSGERAALSQSISAWCAGPVTVPGVAMFLPFFRTRAIRFLGLLLRLIHVPGGRETVQSTFGPMEATNGRDLTTNGDAAAREAGLLEPGEANARE